MTTPTPRACSKGRMHVLRAFHVWVIGLLVRRPAQPIRPGRRDRRPAPAVKSLEARAMTILRENCTRLSQRREAERQVVAHVPGGGAQRRGERRGHRAPATSPRVRSHASSPRTPIRTCRRRGNSPRDEIATLKAWIEAGAEWDWRRCRRRRSATTRPIELRPLPAEYHPVLSLALSPRPEAARGRQGGSGAHQ